MSPSLKVEKGYEIERSILTTWGSAKKKDWNGACEIGCHKSLLIKDWVKKKLSLGYEINKIITKEVKIKALVINNNK